MPANVDPIYPLTAKSNVVQLTAACAATDRTLTTNSVAGPTAGSNGARLDAITFKYTPSAGNTLPACCLSIWHKPSGGTQYMVDEIKVAAGAAATSATNPGDSFTWRPPAGFKFVASGDIFYAGVSVINSNDKWTAAFDQEDY